MPNRVVREGILDSKAVNSLSEAGELFYRRLMSIVDDFGRYEADADLLRAKLFWRQADRWPVSRVLEVLCEVSRCVGDASTPLVTLYDGGKYLQINNFNQRHRSTKSRFPEPMAVIRQSDDGHMADIRQSSARLARATSTSTSTSTSDAEDFEKFFERIYARHPKKRNRTLAEQAMVEHFARGEFTLVDFDRRHGEWCKSGEWTWKGGAKCPQLAEWVTDCGYRYSPPDEQPETEVELPGHMNPKLVGDDGYY